MEIKIGTERYLYDEETKLWYVIYLRAINVIHPNHIIQKLLDELQKYQETGENKPN